MHYVTCTILAPRAVVAVTCCDPGLPVDGNHKDAIERMQCIREASRDSRQELNHGVLILGRMATPS